MPLRTASRSNGYLNEEVNMALTAQEIFVETVRFLSPEEQFHLSVLILQELSVENQSDTWNEQDKKDLTTVSLQYAAALYMEESDLV